MFNERIELIKNLINYLNAERTKSLYKQFREDGVTPGDISIEPSWQCREEEITLEEAYYPWNDDRISTAWDWFDQQDCCEGIQDIDCGVQQISIIFEDEVIKISNCDIGKEVDDFIESIKIPELRNLFGYYYYEDFYRNCYIYSQKRANDNQSKDIPTSNHTLDEVIDGTLSDAIWFQLDSEELFDEFNTILSESEYQIDLHSNNWGFDDCGNVLIFDPIYTGE